MIPIQGERFQDLCETQISKIEHKEFESNSDSIDIDNFEAGKQATERLIRSGAKRILHIAGPIDINSSAQDRFEGYQAALNDAGIAFDQDLVIRADYQVQMAKEEFQQYYSDKGLCFDGIFAANHGMCLAAMEILLADEVSFPGQVQMTSIDKHKPEPYLEYPNITRVTMPLKTIGREAANLLLDKIDGKRIPLRSYYDFNWIEGETTKKVGG